MYTYLTIEYSKTILPVSRWIMKILEIIRNEIVYVTYYIILFCQYILHTFSTSIVWLLFSQNYAGCEKKKNYWCFGECHDSTLESRVALLPFKLSKSACLETGEYEYWAEKEQISITVGPWAMLPRATWSLKICGFLKVLY